MGIVKFKIVKLNQFLEMKCDSIINIYITFSPGAFHVSFHCSNDVYFKNRSKN